MRHTILLLPLSILLFNCEKAIVAKPEKLIDKSTMIDILYDLSIVEALHNTSYGSGLSKYNGNDFILKKYKIDSLQFAKSNQYYASDVINYKKMYEEVDDRLSAKDAEISKKILDEQNKKH
jgi:Domain of unknown function (DUF4296)